jgi:hypothetical protein
VQSHERSKLDYKNKSTTSMPSTLALRVHGLLIESSELIVETNYIPVRTALYRRRKQSTV